MHAQRAGSRRRSRPHCAPDPPVPPRLLRGDLDAIIAKALRKEPEHRYATVDALKRDIELAQRGEPVAAREGARLYCRRPRPAPLSLGGGGGGGGRSSSLAGGLGAAAWQAHRAAIERDIARRDAAREEALRYHLTRLFRTAIADHGGESPPPRACSTRARSGC